MLGRLSFPDPQTVELKPIMPPPPSQRESRGSLDPLAVDRRLAELVVDLAAPDDALAARTEALLARHPLFAFRRGNWPAPANGGVFRRVFFPETQIAAVREALLTATRTAAGPSRARLRESLARFPGLENVVETAQLRWNPAEQRLFDQQILLRDLRQFKPQLTVVLSYQCNKRCPYCFTDALSHQLSRPIAREHFLRALEWASRTGVSRVPVTGGEPTLHPEFPGFLAELRRRNLTTCFSTNGCVPTAIFDGLAADAVEAITFHILDDEDYAGPDTERLEQNLACVKAKGIPLILRYVLDAARPGPPPRLLELAARFRPVMLTFSPVFPGPHRPDMDRNVCALFREKDRILALARAVAGLGIRPVLAKPVPLCMFPREEFLELAAIATLQNVCDVSQNEYTNNLLANPDLSLYPCMALPLTQARMETTPSLEHFGRQARSVVEPLLQLPMLEECSECQLFHRRLCQPACLGFVSPARS